MTTAVRYRRRGGTIEYWCIKKNAANGFDVTMGIVGYPAGYNKHEPHCDLQKYEALIAEAGKNGYVEPREAELFVVGLEYNLNNWGSKQDFDKLTELRSFLVDKLFSRGLLYREGGSIGSGIMECHFFTVDVGLTKAIVEGMVEGTEFSDYYRIFAGHVSNTEYGLLHNPNNPV